MSMYAVRFHRETLDVDAMHAWAAGLFEGEGCITRCNGRPRLSLRMTDEEAVRRFAEVVGVGKVYGPYGGYGYRDGHERRPVFMWVASRVDAGVAYALMEPWLGESRRLRADEVLAVSM